MAETFRMRDMEILERPRERLLHYGVESLSTEELIAILLGSGNQGENAVQLGHRVLALLGKRKYELPSIEDLLSLRGVGPGKACRILAGVELGRRINSLRALKKVKIDCPKSVAELFFDELKEENREHIFVLLLNTKHQILGRERIAIGNLNQAPVHPREVYRPAIRRAAHAIILLHNHPSGDPTPSQDDIAITRRLSEVGELIGIHLLDHIVLGDEKYISLKEQNYF